MLVAAHNKLATAEVLNGRGLQVEDSCALVWTIASIYSSSAPPLILSSA